MQRLELQGFLDELHSLLKRIKLCEDQFTISGNIWKENWVGFLSECVCMFGVLGVFNNILIIYLLFFFN